MGSTYLRFEVAAPGPVLQMSDVLDYVGPTESQLDTKTPRSAYSYRELATSVTPPVTRESCLII